jgi:ABC-2 type transport system permease protein
MTALVNAAYSKAEVGRILRNRRYLLFLVGLPLALFFLITSSADTSTLDGLTVAPYEMVSMATFGVFGAVFSTAGRIAAERASGWSRQLRLTALSGSQYVAGKLTTGYVAAVPAMVLVFLAAAVFRDVHLSAGTWIGVGASILLAALPIAALGIWLGYLVRSDNNQAIAGGIYTVLGFTGGLWIPLETYPRWLQDAAELLPMAWAAKAGRQVLNGSWLGWHGTLVLVAWTVVLGVLAARAYVRDADRP